MSWTTTKTRSTPSKPKFAPHKYQIEGIKWLLQKAFAGLFWDPGMGKTSTVLHAFKILQDKGLVDTLVVVAKRRIIYDTWPDEMQKWRLPFKWSILHGTQEHRLRAMRSPADVYLLNFENLPWFCSLHREWRDSMGRIMFVADESTKLRHINTVRFKALRHKLKFFERRVILTGTPVPNGLMNLYGQMFVVDEGESLGRYIGQYRNTYFHPTGYGGYHWELNPGADTDIYKAIAPRILRLDVKDAKLNLPPLFHVTRKATLNPEARRLYDTLESELLAMHDQHVLTVKNAGVLNNKLRQVANGAIYKVPSEYDDQDKPKDEQRIVIPVHEDKLDALIELLEELNGKPALIAYEYTHDRQRITETILAHGDLKRIMPRTADGVHYVPCIGGGTRDKDASAYIKRWNAGELPVLLGHPESIAHGINLQGPEACVIFFGLTWDLENYLQLIQRVHRQGQKYPVFVYHIVAEDTIDEAVMAALHRKNTTQKKLLDAMLEFAKGRQKHVQAEGDKARKGKPQGRSASTADTTEAA